VQASRLPVSEARQIVAHVVRENSIIAYEYKNEKVGSSETALTHSKLIRWMVMAVVVAPLEQSFADVGSFADYGSHVACAHDFDDFFFFHHTHF
jgi:hypothetical protein